MKVELIKQEGNKVSFKLTVDHDKFESAVVKAYNKIKVNSIYQDSEKVKHLEK